MLAAFLTLAALAPAYADDAHAMVNRICETDADCTVKDLRNCCGAYPACVNVDAVIDTSHLVEQCEGMASVCGFQTVTACQCRDHLCQPLDTRPPAAAPSAPVAQ